MKKIDSQLLFLTTSPRSPEKIIPEIDLLIKHFSGKEWNTDTQCAYMKTLRKTDFFNGKGNNDPAFSARDRINRAPKSLGFVLLDPNISLTAAGEKLLCSKHTDEVFLRQLLKFQIPSPYHRLSDLAADFCVKPYLEILRLIRTLGVLKFDELQIFGMQLTNYHDFNKIVRKIERFREAVKLHKGSYRKFKADYLNGELKRIYRHRIQKGQTKTRESKDVSLEKFLRTQSRNTRDYADACFRYLRITGLVNVSHVGKSLSIVPNRLADVDYILEHVSRKPVFVDNLAAYTEYLGDASTPVLLSDNSSVLLERISSEFPQISQPTSVNIDELKDILADLLAKRKQESISRQITEIKDCHQYEEIQATYEQIEKNELYDAPLMLEWNTWRAMTMIDGGRIQANLKFDDYGNPLSTAAGNMTDILCDYDDYMVCVEVTMASGQRQYETEGESVMRHLGKLKKTSDKPCYGFFIAPKINEACVIYFYTLHHMNLSMYGGKLNIIPLPLNIFRKMLNDSYCAEYTPNPMHIRRIFEASDEYAKTSQSELEWYDRIKEKALHWLD